MIRKLPRIDMKNRYTPFKGGLDVVTPPLSMRPGSGKNSKNVYQGINSGYHTFQGYERFDGQDSPFDGQYATLVVSITGTVAVSDVLTDNAETSYGTVLAILSDYVVLSKITGTFLTGNIKVSSVVVGTCTGAQTVDGASTKLLNAQYKNLAADLYRADIAVIGGASCSGGALGIHYFDGTWYGFRNNSAGTAALMYKSTAAGWVVVALGRELAFTSGGTYEISEGDTIEGETSGSTATITRVMLESGTFAAGTAVGQLIFASQSAAFQSETLKVGANLNTATITGDSSEITFAVPSGRFECINANFTGSASTKRMYGVDGKNRAFEFDGTVFAPIPTGMTADTPSYIYFHKYQLFLSFEGSVQHSAPGLPYQWSIIVGGDEIGMGDLITGFLSAPGDQSSATLAIFTRNTIGMLYGSSVDDWHLVHYKREAGAIEHSMQLIGNTLMLDDRGILKLTTSTAYGNFADATESQLIQPWLKTKRTQLNASCIVRDLNQYWLFFEDKTALCCTVDDGDIVASMPMEFADTVSCIHSTEDSAGNELIMFGDSTGMVHQMYKGTSFDGDEIEWYLDLSWETYGTPMNFKRFRRAMLEVAGEGYAEFFFDYSLEYESSIIEQHTSQQEIISLDSGNWDSGNWDTGVWDGLKLTPSYFPMYGNGTNVSLKLRSLSDYYSPLEFSGALVQFNFTREQR